MARGGRVDVAQSAIAVPTTPVPSKLLTRKTIPPSTATVQDAKMLTPDEDAKLTKMLDENVSLMNADGTENTEAVDLLNKLGEALAKPPVKAGRRRRRTYRKRR